MKKHTMRRKSRMRSKSIKKRKSMRSKSIKKRKSMRSKSMRSKSMRSKSMRSKSMRGGYGRGSGPVGSPWNGGDVGNWPGVQGSHSSNFLPLSPTGVSAGNFDPPMPSNPQFIGGVKHKRHTKQKGGSIATKLLPQDLVNFGRSLTGSVIGTYNKFQGVPRSNSSLPLPYDQPSML